MSAQLYRQAKFLLSAVELKQLPSDEGIEVAFAGRSNAGKSSALNTLTQQKKLARTSKQPGRTQAINVFTLDEQRRLIDLPGYGYAKVPQSVKQRWQKTLAEYLEIRQALKGLVLLMDIRHPLKPTDQALIDWAQAAHLPLCIVLTKADKVKRGAAKQALDHVKKTLSNITMPYSLLLFSSLSGQGLTELYAQLDQWFDPIPKNA